MQSAVPHTLVDPTAAVPLKPGEKLVQMNQRCCLLTPSLTVVIIMNREN